MPAASSAQTNFTVTVNVTIGSTPVTHITMGLDGLLVHGSSSELGHPVKQEWRLSFQFNDQGCVFKPYPHLAEVVSIERDVQRSDRDLAPVPAKQPAELMGDRIPAAVDPDENETRIDVDGLVKLLG